MKKLNFTNYQPDTLEQYQIVRGNTKEVLFDYFHNKVSYNSQEKIIMIDVDSTKEYSSLSSTNSTLSPEQKVDIECASESSPQVNTASGTQIQLPLGEGLLEFCYADFMKKKQYFTLPFLLSNHDFLSEKIILSDSRTNPEDIPVKNIENTSQYQEEIYSRYEKIFISADEFFSQSCYTKIFPPVFLHTSESALQHYLHYISTVQKEFMELLEFCLDVDFYKEDFEHFTGADRYHLYREITDTPSFHKIAQYTVVSPLAYTDGKFPYGYPVSELKQRLEHAVIRKDQTAFEKDYHLEAGTLDRHYLLPSILKTHYAISTIYDMLLFEFTKMLEQGVRLKKCRNCGKYFVLKGKYATEYCSRISADTSLTCQQAASYQNYNGKIKTVPAWAAYNKYYKRYFARYKVGTIKETVFKKWQYQAVNKRDACIDGTLKFEEYINWLEQSFPNRKKKQTPED